MSIWDEMLKEYLGRTGFVLLHGVLLLIYSITFVHSLVLLLRERRALKSLREGLSDLPSVDAVQYPSGEPVRLTKFKEVLEDAPSSSLVEQLRALLSNTSGGEELDSQRVVSRTSHAISWTDDIARFCINGLVVVGLMGTLFAFYQMWRNRSPGAAAAPSDTYLENMSTALIVSLVGLSLAMAANFTLSVLRAWREKYLSEASTLLVPVGGLFNAESKTNLLLQGLMSPLHGLVRQLTVQNEEVLRGLTRAVETRTDELNKLIGDSTVQWQGAIREFKTEMLAAVGDLQSASAELAGSSREVGATMKEVGKGLERTKDIGLIVQRLETTSESIVTRIGKKLDEATTSWEGTLDRATRSYASSLRTQSEALKDVTQLLTADAANNFNAVAAKISSDLNTLKVRYVSDAEAVGAKWMTELSNVEGRVADTLGKIVGGWQDVVNGTATNVGSALAGSRELVREIAGKVAELGISITELQRLTGELSERAGAPLYLAEVVVELNGVNTRLGEMLTGLSHSRLFGGLQDAITENTREVRTLHVRTGQAGSGDGAVAQPLREINAGLSQLRTEVQALSKILQARVVPTPAPRLTAPPVMQSPPAEQQQAEEPPPVEEPPPIEPRRTAWGIFKKWVSRRKPRDEKEEGGRTPRGGGEGP